MYRIDILRKYNLFNQFDFPIGRTKENSFPGMFWQFGNSLVYSYLTKFVVKIKAILFSFLFFIPIILTRRFSGIVYRMISRAFQLARTKTAALLGTGSALALTTYITHAESNVTENNENNMTSSSDNSYVLPRRPRAPSTFKFRAKCYA